MTNKPMQRQGWSPHPPIAPTLIVSSYIPSFLGDGVYIHLKDMHMYAKTHARSRGEVPSFDSSSWPRGDVTPKTIKYVHTEQG